MPALLEQHNTNPMASTAGYVCDDMFSDIDAKMVCKSLGKRGAGHGKPGGKGVEADGGPDIWPACSRCC